MTDGESDHWLGTRIGAGSTVTLAYSFFDRGPWLHVHKNNNNNIEDNEDFIIDTKQIRKWLPKGRKRVVDRN